MTTRGTDEDDQETAVIAVSPAKRTAAALPWKTVIGAPPRFGQLTYTSFHRPGGPGGWQVKDVRGELTEAERRRLVERIATTADGPVRGHRFLTPEEIDQLPRRLVHGPVTDAGVAFWHTVPAGVDSSERPGNVFAHVLLDRAPQAGQPRRPSDLLRSPVWQRPFGADRVLAATLDEVPDPPWPGGPLDRGRVLEFLVQKAIWRGATLVGLLDAVSAALRGGPMVVLGVEEPADAEPWVAAVCHMMSPGTSAGLFFSTSERAGGVAAAVASRLHLVVLPRADLAELDAADTRLVLISDEAGAVEFTDVESGGEHLTVQGSRIRVTPWSSMAQVVLRDAAVAGWALDTQDEIAAEVDDRMLPCDWPLAMAVVTREDLFGDALGAARLALDGPAPPGLARGSRLHRARRAVLRRGIGSSTEEALAAATGEAGSIDGGPADGARAIAVGVYLERALNDRQWLVRPEAVPVPDCAPEELDPDVVDQAHDAIEALARGPAVPGRGPGGATPEERTDAVAALRLLDLTVRAGLLDVRHGPTRVDTALVRKMTERLIGPLLLDPVVGPELVERVGPLAEATQAAFVRPWFDGHLKTAPGRPGTRLAPLLLRWLFPQAPARPSPEQLARPVTIPATVLEVAAQATLVVANPVRFQAAAVVAALDTSAAELARLAAGPLLPAVELRELLRAYQPERLLPLLRASLARARYGEVLDEIADEVLAAAPRLERVEHPLAATVHTLAKVRRLDSDWWQHRGGDGALDPAAQLVDLVETLLAAEPTRLQFDLMLSVIAAHVADLLHRSTQPGQRPGVLGLIDDVEEDGTLPAGVLPYLLNCLRTSALTDLGVVWAAQATSPEPGAVRFGQPWLADIAALYVPKGDTARERLLDRLVRDRVQVDRVAAVAELVAAVHREVQAVASVPGRFPDPGRTMQDYAQFARRWWHGVGVTDDAVLAPLTARGWF